MSGTFFVHAARQHARLAGQRPLLTVNFGTDGTVVRNASKPVRSKGRRAANTHPKSHQTTATTVGAEYSFKHRQQPIISLEAQSMSARLSSMHGGRR